MKICIIEDEVLLAERIQQKLERNGYNVSMYTSYSSFMNQHSLDADLYIIDIALGDGSGFDIINWLRETKKSIAPVIITSGYNDTERKVYGLDIGADDYLPKPFSPRELLARIRALTRRNSEATKTAIIEYKDISLNLENKKVSIGDEEVHLTKKETQIAELFLLQPGKLISKTRFINSVWGGHDASEVTDNTINATLSKVRKKLGTDFRLQTVINEGYILEKVD